MTTAKNNQNFVINTVAATAGDLTIPSQGRVKVTGDTEGFLRADVNSIVVKKFIVETLEVQQIEAAATVAAGTTYRFVIEQETNEDVNYPVVQIPIEYLAPTGVTATIFRTALTALVQAAIDSGQLKATAAAYTSGNSGVTITALTGYPVIRIKQVLNVTATSTLAGATSSGNLSRSGYVLTLLQNDTSDMAVGQLHLLSGWSGGATLNGKTATEGVILRVDSITTNTNVKYVIQDYSGTISAAVAVFKVLASNATGIGADLIADRSITGGGDPNVDIVSTNVYHEVVVSGGERTGKSMTQQDFAPFEKHYFISSTGSAANALLLTDRFEEVAKWYGAGVTTVDPLLLAP